MNKITNGRIPRPKLPFCQKKLVTFRPDQFVTPRTLPEIRQATTKPARRLLEDVIGRELTEASDGTEQSDTCEKSGRGEGESKNWIWMDTS